MRQIGIQGVPFFVFDRKYAVSGAQEPAALLQILEKSYSEWRSLNPPMPIPLREDTVSVLDGPACTPDGACR